MIAYNEWKKKIAETPALLTYVSGENCAVCSSLKPKVESLLKRSFPKIVFLDINAQNSPELTGQLQVFSIPTIIITLEGKESYRCSRNISVLELKQSLTRPYSLLFS